MDQKDREEAMPQPHKGDVTLSPVSELLNTVVSLVCGSPVRWAAVGQHSNLSKKNSFKFQMWGCVTMPRATNERLIIWGKIRMAKQGPDGSLRNCARDPNTDVTRAEWRQEESQNDLKISIFPSLSLCEEQL